jgi:DNA-binding winged helix-turn-helix (wHTH) protein
MKGTNAAGTSIYRFGDVAVDCGRFSVVRDGQPAKITPRAFEVLLYLIENRDRVIEKQELFDQVWKVSFVSDNALTRMIKEIR